MILLIFKILIAFIIVFLPIYSLCEHLDGQSEKKRIKREYRINFDRFIDHHKIY